MGLWGGESRVEVPVHSSSLYSCQGRAGHPPGQGFPRVTVPHGDPAMATDSVVVITGGGVLLALSVGASSAAQYLRCTGQSPIKESSGPKCRGKPRWGSHLTS